MERKLQLLVFLLCSLFINQKGMAQDSISFPPSTEITHESSDSPESMEPEDYETTLHLLEIQEKIEIFFEELNDLQDSYSRPFQISKEQRESRSYIKHLNDDLKQNERKLKSFDLRWNIFYQTVQQEVAADEELVGMVDDLNLLKINVEDSIESRKNILKAVTDYTNAEKFLADQDTIYKQLGKKAMQLSLTSKTAPQLENLKVREQILFTDIQNHYDAARQGAQLFKVSPQELESLDNKFANLKNKSSKIQEITYKPFIQRIKDYLIGLAAVAIIIMFVNMVASKIKAAKKMKENMQKYKDSLNKNDQSDIPTI